MPIHEMRQIHIHDRDENDKKLFSFNLFRWKIQTLWNSYENLMQPNLNKLLHKKSYEQFLFESQSSECNILENSTINKKLLFHENSFYVFMVGKSFRLKLSVVFVCSKNVTFKLKCIHKVKFFFILLKITKL